MLVSLLFLVFVYSWKIGLGVVALFSLAAWLSTHIDLSKLQSKASSVEEAETLAKRAIALFKQGMQLGTPAHPYYCGRDIGYVDGVFVVDDVHDGVFYLERDSKSFYPGHLEFQDEAAFFQWLCAELLKPQVLDETAFSYARVKKAVDDFVSNHER